MKYERGDIIVESNDTDASNVVAENIASVFKDNWLEGTGLDEVICVAVDSVIYNVSCRQTH